MESNKKKKILIVAHVDHAQTSLSSMVVTKTPAIGPTKTIDEIIEESISIPYTAPPKLEISNRSYPVKSGQQNRRERRKQQRNNR